MSKKKICKLYESHAGVICQKGIMLKTEFHVDKNYYLPMLIHTCHECDRCVGEKLKELKTIDEVQG